VPIGGSPPRRTPDVIEEPAETVIDRGGPIEHVQADTPLREYLTATSLRLSLPADLTFPHRPADVAGINESH
jgi:hypothetical protein